MRTAKTTLALLAFALLLPSAALAQTTVGGAINSDTTWTLANSPYLMTADVVVQVGSTLTIEPGVEVQVSNAYSSDVELIVRGGLIANGQPDPEVDAVPIVFHGEASSPGYWEAIVFESTATAVLNYVEVHDAHYTLEFQNPTASNFTLTNLTLENYSLYGIYASTTGGLNVNGALISSSATAGTQYGIYLVDVDLDLSHARVTGNYVGIYAKEGSLDVTESVIDSNRNDGVWFNVDKDGDYYYDFDYTTFWGNGDDAIDGRRDDDYDQRAHLTIDRCIFAENGGYIFRDGYYSSSYRVSFISFGYNVWTGSQFYGVSGTPTTTTSLNYNPLLNDPENGDFAPTDRSPARYYYPDSPELVLGGVDYAGDLTGPGVHGFWYQSHTFDVGSVTEVEGDVVITAGVTMTLLPGAEFHMATDDIMVGGLDATRVEIRVEGTLEGDGTNSMPLILTSDANTPARGDWYGVVILSNTEAFNLSQVDLSYAYRGASLYNNDHIVAGSTIHHCSNAGIWIDDGTPEIEAMDLHDNYRGIYVQNTASVSMLDVDIWNSDQEGLYVDDSSLTWNTGVVRDNGADGISIINDVTTGSSYQSLSLAHLTIAHNTGDGIQFRRDDDYDETLSVYLNSCSVTHNGDFGLRDAYSSTSYRVTISCGSSNVWGNTDGHWTGITSGTDSCVNWNPLYTDLEARDYTPTVHSPNRALGTSGTYIGAYEAGDDLGPQLMGFLWDGYTFTAEDSPYTILGDLYVPDGATVTFEAGSELLIEPDGDGMVGGESTYMTEVRFLDGALAVFPTEGGFVEFHPNTDNPSAGDWRGIKFDDGGDSAVSNAIIEYAQYGLYLQGPTAPSVTDTRIRFSSGSGIYVNDVTSAPDADILATWIIRYGVEHGHRDVRQLGRHPFELSDTPQHGYPHRRGRGDRLALRDGSHDQQHARTPGNGHPVPAGR